MHKNLYKGVFIAVSMSLVASVMLPVAAMADDATVPATSGSDSISGTADQTAPTIPATSGSDSISGTPTVPGTSGSDSISGTNPVVTSPSGSSATGGGSGGGAATLISFYPGGNSTSVPIAVPVVIASSSLASTSTISSVPCPLLNDYITTTGSNNPADVMKLQAFLRNMGGSPDLAMTGIFDAQTIAAVKAFQSAHLSDVMGPWGVSTPTGEVYVTTLHKINDIACNSATALSAQDQALINAYKSNVASGASTDQNVTAGSADLNSIIGATSSVESNPTVGETAPDNSGLTANVTTNSVSPVANFFGNIFSAIGHFFGRK